MTALCSGKICTIFPEKGALNFWKACTIALEYSQSEVEEKAGLGQKYLSNIERSISIPSIEVIMKLAYVLNTTPDEFLIGTLNSNDEEWKKSAELLRPLNSKQLNLVHNFLIWLSEQDM